LTAFTISVIALALEISKAYTTDILAGKRVPHPSMGTSLRGIFQWVCGPL
jgi:hypothetical protein